jgi:hypothetical protein
LQVPLPRALGAAQHHSWIVTPNHPRSQVCEGFADDILFIDMNMMPAVWFSKMASAHLPNITFPATVYHPYDWPHPQSKVQLMSISLRGFADDAF